MTAKLQRIAIVGVGGVFPGAHDLEGFWQNVAAGRDVGRTVPQGRWSLPPEDAFLARGPAPDHVYSTWGCFLEDFAPDLDGLAIDPATLKTLDPLFGIGLHAAGRAWKDAGVPEVSPQRAGVIFGHIVLPTESTSGLARDVVLKSFADQLLKDRAPDWQPTHWSPENWQAAGQPAALIASALHLQGPAYTLDAACASSLYALKLACDELRAQRADVMLAGGLSRPDCQYTQMGFSQLQALSKLGRCAPLSAEADGLVVGEGAGFFVLKRLTDAIRAGDRIYATIAGIGLSNDRGANLLAPRSEGQLRAMRAAYAEAGWQPADVDLIECHATGTPVGDGVELESLHALWDGEQTRPRQCVLGSVKSNVGHLLTGAGAASLMKLIWAFQTRTLPPTANYRQPAPALKRDGSPFRVLAQAEPWVPRQEHAPRRAAINAFGFGGINAHVLIEEWDPDTVKPAAHDTFPKSGNEQLPEIAIIGLASRLGAADSTFQPLQTHSHAIDSDSQTSARTIDEVAVSVTEFRIPPVELEAMLPQQQLMLQMSAAALDDAGVSRELGDRTGVFVGISLDPHTTNFHCRWMIAEYAKQWAEQLGLELSESELTAWIDDLRNAFGPPLTANRVMGNLGGIVASRLGREFEVGGPCFTISSNESSGLRAFDVAVRALQRGDIDQALVGAVDFRSDPRLQALNPQLPHDDGALALVLQRREDAESSGRRIYTIVQEPTADRATTSSDLNCQREIGAPCDLLPIVQASYDLSQQYRSQCHAPWLRDRQAGPRQLDIHRKSHFGTIGWRLIDHDTPVAESQQKSELRQPRGELPAALFIIDGNTPDEISTAAQQLDDWVAGALREAEAPENRRSNVRGLPIGAPPPPNEESGSLESLARRWFQQHPPSAEHPLAAALVVATRDELRQRLKSLQQRLAAGAESIQERGLSFTTQPLGRTGQLAFVFPGSGNHFLGMGRELLTAFPEILRRQDAENERLWSQYRPDIIWHGESTEAIGRDHKTMIFGQVTLGTAVCDWLSLFGVRPQAVIGYSLGESAALFGLQAWRDRDEMLRRMEASPLFGSDLPRPFDAARKVWGIPAGIEVPWLSGVIDRGPREVLPLVEQHSRAYILIINTPSQCVIGGDREQVQQIVAQLQANFVPFPAPSTVHCEILQEVSQAYTQLHLMETIPPSDIEFYSGASGQKYGLSREAAAGAILAQASHTVDFPRVIQNAYRDGVRLFVEIGPGSSCTKMIGEILKDRPHGAWSVTPSTSEPIAQALRVLGELIVHRVPVDLTELYGAQTALPSHQPKTEIGPCVVTPTRIPPWKLPKLPQPTREQPTHPSTNSPKHSTTTEPLTARELAAAPLPLAPAVPNKSSAPKTFLRSSSAPSRPAATLMPTSAPPAQNTFAPTNDPILRAWDRWMAENIAAHESFLRFSQQAQTLAAELIANPAEVGITVESDSGDIAIRSTERVTTSAPSPSTLNSQPPTTPPRSLDYEQCLEFAIGKIGNVLGPKFAEIDQFPTRVRLPDVPLMLVDRILEIEGEPLSMTKGRVVTEKDIFADDWYLDCGRIPTCLAVESGQADLFLSGWLGIDLQTRGLACYRLLDAVVTFHDELPGPGKTIHYDIRINGFFRQGNTYLFRFEFDATVNGQPLLTMRDGCAGFFTEQELAAGQGIIHTALDRQPQPGKRPDDWYELVPLHSEQYDDDQLTSLRNGDLAGCFGREFAGLQLSNPVTLPSGRLNLVHRVLSLDPQGGKYSLGQIRAEADIHPDDWFLTCHFCDDQVMPGTLMYECCLHTLRIYLLRMGWIGEAGHVAYEPIPGVKSRLKCRGQVLASTQKVWYEVTLKEIGYGGPGSVNPGESTPYAIANALMFADGKPIVEITDMTVRLAGLTREAIEALWEQSRESRVESPEPRTQNPLTTSLNPQPLFDTDRITAFAIGKPSEAFGDRYRVFDDERKIARLPGPPFQFLDRIVSIRDCAPWVLAAGGTIVAEYDVPPDAWYFESSRSESMPFAVLLETALQPCGWLAAYLGSALTSETDLSFRNLGGKATQFQPVTRDSGTLSTTVKMTRVSQSAGMIIQHYDYDLRCNGDPVYVGNTYFGFFSKDALANQVGIREAKVYQPTSDELARANHFPVPLAPPYPDDRWCMIRRVDALILDGGPQGLGYVRGSVDVDPSMWFFQAHFYQDPVWPGSLGLESFLQLLRVYADARWGQGSEIQNAAVSPFHFALNSPHEWVYRGQVIPRDKTVTVEVVVTAVDDENHKVMASGFLTVDGRVIYQMIDFAMTVQ